MEKDYLNKHKQTLLSIITSSDFFINEAMDAFEEMSRLVGEPITKANVDKFNAAKGKFTIAVARARKEHANL